MAVLALHGFLGSGHDWSAVRGKDWITPSLFAPDSNFNLNSPEQILSQWVGLSKHAKFDGIGYSLGGRLLLTQPELFHRLVIVSAHPGLVGKEERRDRLVNDLEWKKRLQSLKWNQFIKEWNSQSVLIESTTFDRKEDTFDKLKLAEALDQLSLGRFDPDFKRLQENKSKITWVVGAKDTKFFNIYKVLKAEGIIEDLVVIENSGHRVIADQPKAFKQLLVDRGIL